MSRTAQTHDRENAPRQLQHAARGRHFYRAACCERRPAWDLARGRPFRPWRKKGEQDGRGTSAASRGYRHRRALRRPIGESAIT